MTIAISIALLAIGAVFGFALAGIWASISTIRQAEREEWGNE